MAASERNASSRISKRRRQGSHTTSLFNRIRSDCSAPKWAFSFVLVSRVISKPVRNVPRRLHMHSSDRLPLRVPTFIFEIFFSLFLRKEKDAGYCTLCQYQWRRSEDLSLIQLYRNRFNSHILFSRDHESQYIFLSYFLSAI